MSILNKKKIPKVAILLAAHNGEKFIYRQIKSILSQQNVQVFIFINDDGSKDATIKICNSLVKIYSNITLFENNELRFGSSAANFFNMIEKINFDKYDFVGFSDQDDIWRPYKIFRAINKIEECFDGYSSNVRPFHKKKLLKTVNKSNKQTEFDFLFEGGGAGSTILLKKKVIQGLQVHLLNSPWIKKKINHHDWLTYAFTRYKYGNWYIDKYNSVYYRQHNYNELGSSDSVIGFFKRLKMVMSGYAFTQSKLIAKAISLENNLYKQIYHNKYLSFFLIMNFYKLRRSYKGKFIILLIGFVSFFHKI